MYPVLQEWLETLQRLQEAPSTRTVYLLGIPTARVPDATHMQSYKSRNRVCSIVTRSWLAVRLSDMPATSKAVVAD